jgi:hypothetical protein
MNSAVMTQTPMIASVMKALIMFMPFPIFYLQPLAHSAIRLLSEINGGQQYVKKM